MKTNESQYRAVDVSGDRIRWLHMNGTELTTDRFWSWLGTEKQFENLCGEHEWDGLSLLPANKSG